MLARYETGGASTAASAARRMSINVFASRVDRSIEALVISARVSRTGLSLWVELICSLLRFDGQIAGCFSHTTSVGRLISSG
jgi:hypothetical protein